MRSRDNVGGAYEQRPEEADTPEVDAGTVLFAIGIIATIAAAATGSLWLVGVAVALLVPGR